MRGQHPGSFEVAHAVAREGQRYPIDGLRIEESYPTLNDALASTVQFLEQGKPPADSASVPLQREAVKRLFNTLPTMGIEFAKEGATVIVQSNPADGGQTAAPTGPTPVQAAAS